MPIPDFNADGVLPPHGGNPTSRVELSPFAASILELCQKFATTPERRAIFSGLIRLREALAQVGILNGFQWIDGSFLEDVERLRGRAPGDIDVVTFYRLANVPFAVDPAVFAVLADHGATKNSFHVDHQLVNLAWEQSIIVEHTRYWCGLFSHQRDTGIWKGMARIDLGTALEDNAAAQHLASLSLP